MSKHGQRITRDIMRTIKKIAALALLLCCCSCGALGEWIANGGGQSPFTAEQERQAAESRFYREQRLESFRRLHR